MATEADDFKLTKEEAEQLRQALKKEEFRKLLLEYAEEISDPKNKKLYEEDIKKLESERGMDVQFVYVKPKFVLKTTTLPSRKKLFINIGVCDLIGAASAVTSQQLPKGKRGSHWSIPYTITKPRDDIDNGKKCLVVDVGFHSETMNQVNKDHRFNELITNTAIEGIERDLGLTIDHKHVKKMKFEYKGTPQPAVIRKKKDPGIAQNNSQPSVKQDDPGPFKIPYPPIIDQEKTAKHQHTKKLRKKANNEPLYTIVHRGEFDMQDFTYSPINGGIKRPKELVVTVDLPKLESTRTVELDIFEKKLILVNEKPNYHLELNLSYPVDEESTKAKFDKSARTLTITLPVLPPATPTPPHPHITTHPLVEPIEDDITPESNNETDDIDKNPLPEIEPDPISPTVRSDWSINEAWECPPFSYRQSEDCVSFVLHVAVVKEKTLTSHFDQNSLHVTFRGSETSIDEFKSYSFYVEFDQENGCGPLINTDNCKVDVGSENTVIAVAKGSEQILDKFRVGSSPTKLTESLFLTGPSVSRACDRSDHPAIADPWAVTTQCPTLNVEVTQKGDKESVVTITGKKETPPTDTVTIDTKNENETATTDDNVVTPPIVTSPTDAPPIFTQSIDTSSNNENTTETAATLRMNGSDECDLKEDTRQKVVPSIASDIKCNGSLTNGCGHNDTVHDKKRFIKFSNDLMYDLD